MRIPLLCGGGRVRLAAALLAASCLCGAAERMLPAGGEFQCGVNFGFYAREGYYESAAARAAARLLKRPPEWQASAMTATLTPDGKAARSSAIS